jgi:hypothetical protein
MRRWLIRRCMISLSTRVTLNPGEAFVISTHKSGIRRFDLVDCDAVPAVLALHMSSTVGAIRSAK